MSLANKNNIVFVRSAFLGDFLVCLPFINQFIIDNKIDVKNVYFLIFNNNGTNPLSIIFGENHSFARNTRVINTSVTSLTNIFNNYLNLHYLEKISKVIYIPMWNDSFRGQFLKYLILRLNFGFNIAILGFFKIKRNRQVVSQYLYPFSTYNIEYNEKYVCLELFENYNPIVNPRNRKQFLIYANSKLKMKIWPIEKFKCLIELILNRYDCDIFLIGGKADFEYNNILLNMIANSNNIRNVAGKFSIEETIDLMINSDILIGNDGFPLHLAALCNIPIVGIFSYKNPIGCWDPIIASKMITIRSYATCKECYLEECDNPVCVKYISVNSIIRSIDKILESPSISSIEIQNIGNNLNRDFLQPNFLNKNNII